MRTASGARNQQTARAGEHLVAAELKRRGVYAVTFAGNMPKIDILASDIKQSRTVTIQVKSKRAPTWQTSLNEAKLCRQPSDETSFWVFVDLSKPEQHPNYYIMPDWWVSNYP